MLEKCVLTILELNWNQRLGHKKTRLNIYHHMLTSSTQLQNSSFHVVERTRTSLKCQKMKNARVKRAEILLFIVEYANLWGFCCRRPRGCLSSLSFTSFIHECIQRHFVFHRVILLNCDAAKCFGYSKLWLNVFAKSWLIKPLCVFWKISSFDSSSRKLSKDPW